MCHLQYRICYDCCLHHHHHTPNQKSGKTARKAKDVHEGLADADASGDDDQGDNIINDDDHGSSNEGDGNDDIDDSTHIDDGDGDGNNDGGDNGADDGGDGDDAEGGVDGDGDGDGGGGGDGSSEASGNDASGSDVGSVKQSVRFTVRGDDQDGSENATVYGVRGSASAYGGNATVYGGSASAYGGSATVYGGSDGSVNLGGSDVGNDEEEATASDLKKGRGCGFFSSLFGKKRGRSKTVCGTSGEHI